MSATTASAKPAEPVVAKPANTKKKLVIIGVVLALVLAGGGAGAAFYLKKKHAAAELAAAEAGGDSGADADSPAKLVKASLKNAPTFVPLEPFTVNLADREGERYAQVGMTLELTDAKASDLLKAYMPAIRNNVLLVLAGKTASQLIEHDGKVQLAAEVRAAALKPLGYATEARKQVPKEAPTEAKTAAPAKAHASDEDDAPPIRAVHFSTFIIQ